MVAVCGGWMSAMMPVCGGALTSGVTTMVAATAVLRGPGRVGGPVRPDPTRPRVIMSTDSYHNKYLDEKLKDIFTRFRFRSDQIRFRVK